MRNKLQIITAFMLISTCSIAMAEGSTEVKKSTTDSAGTTVTTENSRHEAVNSDGSDKVTEEAKTVVDPKGMMNEKSAIVQTEREKKENGDFTNSNTIKKADGTEVKESLDKSTASHWTDKGKTTTTTHSKSVDPIGLGNKRTEEVEKKVITNSKGVEEINVTKKIDGETVFEEKKVN